MLINISNLSLHTKDSDLTELLKTKCGITDMVLGKLELEAGGQSAKVTVGVMEEADAALIVRKINGFTFKGRTLFVENKKQNKDAEQPYRPKPEIQKRFSELYAAAVAQKAQRALANSAQNVNQVNVPPVAATNQAQRNLNLALGQQASTPQTGAPPIRPPMAAPTPAPAPVPYPIAAVELQSNIEELYEPPQFDQAPQQFNQPSQPFNRPPSRFDQPPLRFDQPPRRFDQPPQGFNQPHPGFNQPHPGFNQPHPGFNQPHPGLNQPHPGFNQPHPGFNQPHPGFNQPHPGFNQQLPSWSAGNNFPRFPGQQMNFGPDPNAPNIAMLNNQNNSVRPQVHQGPSKTVQKVQNNPNIVLIVPENNSKNPYKNIVPNMKPQLDNPNQESPPNKKPRLDNPSQNDSPNKNPSSDVLQSSNDSPPQTNQPKAGFGDDRSIAITKYTKNVVKYTLKKMKYLDEISSSLYRKFFGELKIILYADVKERIEKITQDGPLVPFYKMYGKYKSLYPVEEDVALLQSVATKLFNSGAEEPTIGDDDSLKEPGIDVSSSAQTQTSQPKAVTDSQEFIRALKNNTLTLLIYTLKKLNILGKTPNIDKDYYHGLKRAMFKIISDRVMKIMVEDPSVGMNNIFFKYRCLYPDATNEEMVENAKQMMEQNKNEEEPTIDEGDILIETKIVEYHSQQEIKKRVNENTDLLMIYTLMKLQEIWGSDPSMNRAQHYLVRKAIRAKVKERVEIIIKSDPALTTKDLQILYKSIYPCMEYGELYEQAKKMVLSKAKGANTKESDPQVGDNDVSSAQAQNSEPNDQNDKDFNDGLKKHINRILTYTLKKLDILGKTPEIDRDYYNYLKTAIRKVISERVVKIVGEDESIPSIEVIIKYRSLYPDYTNEEIVKNVKEMMLQNINEVSINTLESRLKKLTTFKLDSKTEKHVLVEIDTIIDIMQRELDKLSEDVEPIVIFQQQKAINYMKRYLKFALSRRITDEGIKTVRVNGCPKLPEKDDLEKFLVNYNCVGVEIRNNEPFYTALFENYKSVDDLVELNRVTIGSCENETIVEFQYMNEIPLQREPKWNQLHKYHNFLMYTHDNNEVNLLDKNWPQQLGTDCISLQPCPGDVDKNNENTIETNEKTIENTEKTIQNNVETVKHSEKTTDNNEETITNNEETITNNEKTLENNEKTLENNERAIENNKTNGNNGETITNNGKTIQSNENTVKNIEQTNENTIKDNEKAIENNEKTIVPKEILHPLLENLQQAVSNISHTPNYELLNKLQQTVSEIAQLTANLSRNVKKEPTEPTNEFNQNIQVKSEKVDAEENEIYLSMIHVKHELIDLTDDTDDYISTNTKNNTGTENSGVQSTDNVNSANKSIKVENSTNEIITIDIDENNQDVATPCNNGSVDTTVNISCNEPVNKNDSINIIIDKDAKTEDVPNKNDSNDERDKCQDDSSSNKDNTIVTNESVQVEIAANNDDIDTNKNIQAMESNKCVSDDKIEDPENSVSYTSVDTNDTIQDGMSQCNKDAIDTIDKSIKVESSTNESNSIDTDENNQDVAMPSNNGSVDTMVNISCNEPVNKNDSNIIIDKDAKTEEVPNKNDSNDERDKCQDDSSSNKDNTIATNESVQAEIAANNDDIDTNKNIQAMESNKCVSDDKIEDPENSVSYTDDSVDSQCNKDAIDTINDKIKEETAPNDTDTIKAIENIQEDIALNEHVSDDNNEKCQEDTK